MFDLSGMRKETRYGMPAADLILFNQYYIVGYSYYIRQAKWALEIVDPDKINVERLDNFRPDFRVPPMFRADLDVYQGSGFDRGHLVASADQNETNLQNSETFLLSNMSPQAPGFNRVIWRQLEDAVRQLNDQEDIYETYVISGPIFLFDVPITTIKSPQDGGVTLPVPHSYFKSVLTEDKRGNLHMWSFILENAASNKPLSSFQVTTKKVEQYAGILLWGHLGGAEIEKEKSTVRTMWHVG